MRNLKYVFLLCCFLCHHGYAQQDINLSVLDLSHAWQEFGTVQKGKSVDGKPAVVAGKQYNDVVGVHAKSTIKVNLDKQAIRFTAKIAIAESNTDLKDNRIATIPLVDGTKLYFEQKDNAKQFLGLTGPADSRIAKGKVYFIIKGDGKELYRSAWVKGGDEPLAIDLDVRKIGILELLVYAADDGASGDHALWIDPKFTYTGKAPYTVSVGAQGAGPEMITKVRESLKRKIGRLPEMKGLRSDRTPYDWLIHPGNSKAEVYGEKDGKSITIANGMVSRTFRIFPNLATIDITNRMLGEGLIRAVSSEGTIDIDGKRWNIGGLSGQPERGYLRQEWIDEMKTLPESFMVADFEVGPIVNPIDWKKRRWALSDAYGTGKELVFTLRGEKELRDVVVKVYFAIYDQVPVIRKRMQVINVNAINMPDEAEKIILENRREYYKRENDKVNELAVLKELINKYVLPEKHTANIRKQIIVLDKNNYNPVAQLDSTHAASSVSMYADALLKIDSTAESLKLANQLLDKSQALTAETLYYTNIKNMLQYNFGDKKKSIKAQSALVKEMTKKKDVYLQDAKALLTQMNSNDASLKFVAFKKD